MSTRGPGQADEKRRLGRADVAHAVDMEILRTPDECFEGLVDYPFAARYTDAGGLRMHHVEAGNDDAPPVVMLHGELAWSYLYRKVMPPVAEAGYRVLAPDLIGFGRSDKPARPDAHTCAAHVEWVSRWLAALELDEVTLVCQGLGSLVGLRLVALMPNRFSAIVVSGGFLPTGEQRPGLARSAWNLFSSYSPVFPVGWLVQAGCRRSLTKEEKTAYEAPFPTPDHIAGVREFHRTLPVRPDEPEAGDNRRAWATLATWSRPLVTACGEGDPFFKGADKLLQQRVPGAAGQEHAVLPAGHFVQEDAPEEFAEVVTRAARAGSSRGLG